MGEGTYALVGGVFALGRHETTVTGTSKFLHSWTEDIPSSGAEVMPTAVAAIVDLDTCNVLDGVAVQQEGYTRGPWQQIFLLHNLLDVLAQLPPIKLSYVIWPRLIQTLIQPLNLRSRVSAKSAGILSAIGNVSQIDPVELMFRNLYPTATDRFGMTVYKMGCMLGNETVATNVVSTLEDMALVGRTLK